jgi:hypothetical protein
MHVRPLRTAMSFNQRATDESDVLKRALVASQPTMNASQTVAHRRRVTTKLVAVIAPRARGELAFEAYPHWNCISIWRGIDESSTA